jgi:hypothetical protein
MRVFHTNTAAATAGRPGTLAFEATFERLRRQLTELYARNTVGESFEGFERAVHQLFVQAECEVLAEGLEGLDVDVPSVLIEGQLHHRVLRGPETYTSAVGPVTVTRTLYRAGRGQAVVPLELRAGMVEGHFTPLAARQATWVIANLTPTEGEELFRELGNMQPSKSSLDRLPKRLSERWEAKRLEFEEALRAQTSVPPTAVTVAVSLDGVLTPMKDGESEEKRLSARAQGKQESGPVGYQEVGCATLSFYDAEGTRFPETIRLGRMPESKKVTLKSMISAELHNIREQRPDLRIAKVADGAKDNWTYLHEELPTGTEIVDFFHAAEHLKDAFDGAYGANSAEANAQFKKYRHLLREDQDGVDKVIRALGYLRQKHPRRKRIRQVLGYFRRNRRRMAYAEAKSQHLPIGSGVVEAACKTLVTQRMKRSGMRWRHAGGQAVLTFRALGQSNRFEQAWHLVSQTYRATVSLPDNVVPFPGRAPQ